MKTRRYETHGKEGKRENTTSYFFFPHILFSESHPSSQGSSGVHQGWERICLGHIKACLKIVDSDSRLPANSTLGSLAHAWNKGSMGTRMGSTSGKNRQNSRGRHCLDSLGSSDLTQEKVESSVTLHGLARSQASLGWQMCPPLVEPEEMDRHWTSGLKLVSLSSGWGGSRGGMCEVVSLCKIFSVL